LALLYDPKKPLIPLKIKFKGNLATSTITAIRVQDVARDIWYSWDNGTWDNAGGGGNNAAPGQTPMITPGSGNLYVSFYATHNYSYTVSMTLYLEDSNGNIIASVVNHLTNPGSGTALEWTGNMPSSPYELTLISYP